VAPTRQLYGDYEGSFKEDLGLEFHEGENRGQRTRVQHATQTREMVAVKFASTNGVPYDILPIFFAALNGTALGVGAGADKTWTQDPLMTVSNAPKSFTLDVGDDVQNWRLQYVMWQSIKLAGSAGGLTSIEVNGFAQRAIKAAAAVPAANQAIKIPGSLWTLKFAATAAGLTGAAVQANLLRDWEMTVNTGLTAQDYADGNLYFGQHQESLDISGQIALTVDNTAGVITEFYDKYKANPPTLSFLRLRATGPVLGASNYQAGFDFPAFYDDVEPLGGEQDGVNLVKVSGKLANDVTTAKSLQSLITVCSIAALP
jgi:hypothetical protein